MRRRVIEAVTELSDEPRSPGSLALTGSPGWRRIRIGSYRVVYDIHDESLIVLVVRVGSRGSVYRHLSE